MTREAVPNVAPCQLRKGDRFVATQGPCAGQTVEVISINPGRYGTYRVEARVVSRVEVIMDYSNTVTVAREKRQRRTPSWREEG